MNYLSLADLKQLPESTLLNPPAEKDFIRPLHGISIDSRSLKANQVFWALKGDKFDGHDFIIDAVRSGAAAVVIDHMHTHKISGMSTPVIVVKDTLQAMQKMAALHRKKYSIPILAITGTNGKTTTKEMLAWILHTKFNVHKTRGNLNNHIGVPLTLLHLNPTHQISIIEMGTNHPGEIAALSSLVHPTAALITNIGRGHLEFFTSIEGVAREKMELFRNVQEKGLVFLNKDDLFLAGYSSPTRFLYCYSLQKAVAADVHGQFEGLNESGEGTWKLNSRTQITMQISGLHNIQNALAASAAALKLGCTEDEIKTALEHYSGYDKRMQIIRNRNMIIINDSYNANPDSFLPALETLQHMAARQVCRKIAVLGDMLELGAVSAQLHQEVLQKIRTTGVDGIFILGELFRSAAENLHDAGTETIQSYSSHQELAEGLKDFIKPNDIILIKGSRGMQMEKILAFL
jgi:UDP-N-acetylmuramoyl-tripeptide--D-alanyl-D-alanine ligase